VTILNLYKYGQEKNSKSLLECLATTALVAAFDAKAFNETELLKSCLVGGNMIFFISINQPKTSRLST